VGVRNQGGGDHVVRESEEGGVDLHRIEVGSGCQKLGRPEEGRVVMCIDILFDEH
jgi:hypothetical protein